MPTKRVTKYRTDDGTEFERRRDADIYPALVVALERFIGSVDLSPEDAARELISDFDITGRTR